MKKVVCIVGIMMLLTACGSTSKETDLEKAQIQEDVQEYIEEILQEEAEIDYFQIEEKNIDDKESTASVIALVKYEDSDIVNKFTVLYELSSSEWELASIKCEESVVAVADTEKKEKAKEKKEDENNSSTEKVKEVEEVSTESKEETKEIEKNENREMRTQLPTELGDNWTDYQIELDGVIYQFPMYMQDIFALGWEPIYKDDMEEILMSYWDYSIQFENKEMHASFDVFNLDINAHPTEECIVGGINLDRFIYEEMSDVEMKLPGGITWESKKDEIIEVYGQPTEITEYEGRISHIKYQLDYHEHLDFRLDEEGNIIEISMNNYVLPEDFEYGEVSDDIPYQVSNYEIPKELGTDLEDYVFSMDGVLYRVPFPLQELLANGWVLIEDVMVESGSYNYCEIIKDNVKSRHLIKNYSENAVMAKNCMIESVGSFWGSDATKPTEVAGGICIGMTEEELQGILEKAEVDYEVEESEYCNYYIWAKDNSGLDHIACKIDNETKIIEAIEIKREYEE